MSDDFSCGRSAVIPSLCGRNKYKYHCFWRETLLESSFRGQKNNSRDTSAENEAAFDAPGGPGDLADDK